MNLEIWDWRYRIGISPNNLNTVNEYIKAQDINKKSIYNSMIEFFYEIVPFDAILDELMSKKLTSFNEYDLYPFDIIKRRIMYIPELLKDYYLKKCNICIANNPNLKDNILELFDLACNKKPLKTDLKFLYKLMYKDKFKDIQKNISNVIKPNYVKTSNKIDPENIEDCFKKIFFETINNKNIIDKFGKFEYDLKDFNIQIDDNVGFAEWWNKELSKTDKDLLILYKNSDSLNIDDFIYTFYHEVYPGHGHFYNTLRKGDFTNYDYGNFELIEGWATYCEWNTIDSGYSKLLRYKAAEYLKNSFSNSSEKEKIDTLYKNKLKNSYSDKEVINSVLYFNQYPGFVESYYVGGFLIECLSIEKNNLLKLFLEF